MFLDKTNIILYNNYRNSKNNIHIFGIYYILLKFKMKIERRDFIYEKIVKKHFVSFNVSSLIK